MSFAGTGSASCERATLPLASHNNQLGQQVIKIFLQALVFESIFQSLFASSAQAITCADLFRHSSTSQIDTLAPIPQDGPQFHAYALTKASEARTSRFKEFEIIREVAARHGLRIWLWGESAGAYSGYTLKILGTHRSESVV